MNFNSNKDANIFLMSAVNVLMISEFFISTVCFTKMLALMSPA